MDLFNIINLTIIGGICYCLFHNKKIFEEENKIIINTAIVDTPPKYTLN